MTKTASLNIEKALKPHPYKGFRALFSISTQQDDSNIKHNSLILALFYALQIHVFHIIYSRKNLQIGTMI